MKMLSFGDFGKGRKKGEIPVGEREEQGGDQIWREIRTREAEEIKRKKGTA